MNSFDIELGRRNVASYINEARAMICRFAGKDTALLNDEDAITNVATAIAKAEYDFDPSRGCKRVTLRMTYGKYQIWRELKVLSRNKKTLSIDRPKYNDEDEMYGIDVEDHRECTSKKMEENEEIEKKRKMARRMIQCHLLTKLQREYLHLRYVKGVKVRDIAKRKRCSKQAVSQVLGNAIIKLKGMYFEDNISR